MVEPEGVPERPEPGEGSDGRRARRWLAAELKAWRTASGLTQREVAAAVGWRVPRVSLLELGELVPDDDDLRSLLTNVGVPHQEWPVYFAVADDARAEAILDGIEIAPDAADLVAAVVAGARYDALAQLAHQLCGVFWALEQAVQRPKGVAALQEDRRSVRARMAVIGPETTAVPVVGSDWGQRLQLLRPVAAQAEALAVTDEQLDQVFIRAIAPVLAGDSSGGHDRPHAVLVIGPAGAGLATVVAEARDVLAFGAGGIAPVLVDELRAYHPAYTWLLAHHPRLLVDLTDPAARYWQQRLIDALCQQRRHLLIDDTTTPPQDVIARAEALAAAGYQVHLRVIADPAAITQLTAVESYRHQRNAAGAGHWYPAASHHAGFTNTRRTVVLATLSDAITDITVAARYGPPTRRPARILGPHLPPTRAPSEQLDAAHTSLTPAHHSALTTQLAHTLDELNITGYLHQAAHLAGGPAGIADPVH